MFSIDEDNIIIYKTMDNSTVTITLTQPERELLVKCVFHAIRTTDNPILAAQELKPLWEKLAGAGADVNGTEPGPKPAAGN